MRIYAIWHVPQFYLERFGFMPIISNKITSVEQNEITNIIHKCYKIKTENTIMNSQQTEDKS